MNYLMAKTQGRGAADFLVISQEEDFYVVPTIDHSLEYMDDYKLQENEWFKLPDICEKPYCLDVLTNEFDATAHSNLPHDHYPKLGYLYVIQDDKVFFQKITRSKILQKRLISFNLNQEPTILNSEYVVVLNSEPDAYYNMADRTLYFRCLSDITNIFKGIDELFREATNQETQDFLNLDLVNAANDFGVDQVKTANRRRIKAAMEKYNGFSDEQKELLPEYIQEYCPNLAYDQNTKQYTVSTEDELTNLLNGINQRFYTTSIDGEKRLANSVTSIQ